MRPKRFLKTVTPEQLRKVIELKNEEEVHDALLELRKTQYRVKLREEFEPLSKAIDERRAELWKELLADTGVDSIKSDATINIKTGEISLYIGEPEDEMLSAIKELFTKAGVKVVEIPGIPEIPDPPQEENPPPTQH